MATDFFQRWSSRKLAAREEQTEAVALANQQAELSSPEAQQSEIKEKNTISSAQVEADNESADSRHNHIPPVTHDAESEKENTAPTLDDVADVTFDSGVASFMKSGVEKSVKKAALRKLFHSDEFNYVSDMDDCTEDFSNLKALDSSVTKQLRNWMSEVVDEFEDASEKSEAGESAEQVELESMDIQFDPNQLIEKETEASLWRESIPTSAEGDASAQVQEEQLVKDDVLVAEQETRTKRS
ncbi:DUF3306 domain-containing protein [uncultured Photobacterium sp.]|uniref:DUF3306 domain-containing protein n=1 Tax=uncultured Photobacterium sp. TaxID=173973 RepID=UPI00261BBF77|nr:DUF3306 domain-containing protein [uncultured Photobacterium sp.]